MFRKSPTDIGTTIVVIWIGLGLLIGVSLYKIDQLMEILAQYLFN